MRNIFLGGIGGAGAYGDDTGGAGGKGGSIDISMTSQNTFEFGYMEGESYFYHL